jgi:hypothetical protein
VASHSKPNYKTNNYINEASIYVKVDIFTFRLVVHLVDRLADRLVDRLADRLVDRLVASHIKRKVSCSTHL